MNKITTFLAASIIASVTFADITQFAWSGGSVSDGVTASDYIHTFIDDDSTADMLTYISGNTINLTDLQSNFSTPFDVQNATIVPFGADAGQWASASMGSTDNALVGKYVYCIVSASGAIGSIAESDTFLLSETDGLIAAGASPPATPSLFSPGTMTTVSVVPEPATVGLFGLGALSAWIVRRNKAKKEVA